MHDLEGGLVVVGSIATLERAIKATGVEIQLTEAAGQPERLRVEEVADRGTRLGKIVARHCAITPRPADGGEHLPTTSAVPHAVHGPFGSGAGPAPSKRAL